MPRGRCFRTHAIDHDQRPRPIAGGEESVGECQPQTVFASSRRADRTPCERFGFGGPVEFQQDQRALLRLHRTKQAIDRDLVDGREGPVRIAPLGGVPGGQ